MAIAVSVLFWFPGFLSEEASQLISFSGTLEMVPPNESYQSGRQVIQQATLTLANYNGRYDLDNTNSELYTWITGGRIYRTKVEVQVQLDGATWDTIFVGYIKYPKYDFVGNKVTFTLWDIGEILRQKFSTVMLRDYLEHEVVIYYLELAGMVDGENFISPTYAETHALDPTIEASATPIPFSWLDDEPIWDEIVKLGQASGSRAYVDRTGLIHYERTRPWLATLVYTPFVLDNTYMADIVPQVDDKSFYDAVLVEYSERVPGQAGEELWKLPKPKIIQAGATESIIARFSKPAISVDPPAITITNIGGAAITSGVTVTVDPIYAQQATIEIVNGSGAAVYLSKGSLTGIAIHGSPSEQTTQPIGTPTYNRRVEIRGNVYIQSKLQADVIKAFIAWWYGTIRGVYVVRGVMGQPTLDIGRRVDVRWLSNSEAGTYIENNKRFIILKVDFRLGVQDNGAVSYTQDFTLLEDLFSSDNFYIIGTSTLGGPAVLWY